MKYQISNNKFQIIHKIQFPKFQFNDYSPQMPALMKMGDAKNAKKADQKHILAAKTQRTQRKTEQKHILAVNRHEFTQTFTPPIYATKTLRKTVTVMSRVD